MTIPAIMGTAPAAGPASASGPASAASADPAENEAAGNGAGEDEDRYDEPTDDVLAGARPADAEPADAEPADTGPADTGPAGHGAEAEGAGQVAAAPEATVLPEPPGRATAVPVRPSLPGRQRPAPAATHQPARERPAAVPSAIASKLETSPFWLGGEEHDRSGQAESPAPPPSRLGVPPRRVPPAPRRPATGLVVLVLLSMVAAFFAWVSAEPLWLATGHGERGTATVTRCTGAGVAQRCRGDFVADGGRVTVPGVALLGVAADRRAEGSVVPARLVSAQSRQAFAGDGGITWHLRWAIGVVMVLLCGLGIAAATGARRLATARARRTAVLLSLAGPVALLAGFLAITY